MQSKIKQSILCGVGLLGLAGVAQAELTANVGVTTNYVFRGETQTDDNIAIQGGVDFTNEFEHDGSLYVGAWASNVDFPAYQADGFEIDLYVGYNFKLNESVKFDVGYIAYEYTDSNLPDLSEIFFGAGFKDLYLYYYIGDRDSGPDYTYVDLKYSYEFPQEWVLHLHYGNLNDDATNGDAEDVSVGVSKILAGIDFSLTATSIDRDSPTNPDDTYVFLTGVKTFDFK